MCVQARIHHASCVHNRMYVAQVSFIKLERQSTPGKDGFDLKYTSAQTYQFMTSEGGKDIPLTQKNFCRLIPKQVYESAYLTVSFRYRFEKVGKNVKPLKPYVTVKKGFKLTKGKPLRVA